MDWDDPAQRFQLAEKLGAQGYNEAFEKHCETSRIATIKGHHIRPISSRFGRLLMIEGKGTAFRTLAECEEFLNAN